MDAVLQRQPSHEHGTLGLLTFNHEACPIIHGFRCATIEPPWKDNEPFISCIPEGFYTCEKVMSDKFGQTFEIMNVLGRTDILFHWGNYAGDVDRNYFSDTQGCVIVGEKHGMLSGQKVVLSSKVTFALFMTKLRCMDKFPLEIRSQS
jgi:hypothetical protein